MLKKARRHSSGNFLRRFVHSDELVAERGRSVLRPYKHAAVW
jgi:hypothetical protein